MEVVSLNITNAAGEPTRPPQGREIRQEELGATPTVLEAEALPGAIRVPARTGEVVTLTPEVRLEAVAVAAASPVAEYLVAVATLAAVEEDDTN